MRALKSSLPFAVSVFLLIGMMSLGGSMKTRRDDTGTAEKVQAKTKDYQYKSSTLKIKQEKKMIYGKIFIPKAKKKKFPTIIYSHGFGGNYENGVAYAETLAKKGYAVYCFDFCGGGPDSRSSGSTLDMSIFTEQKDLEAVIKSLKKQNYVDRKNIFLFGASQGGVVSAITAAKHQNDVCGLILFYPAFGLVDDAKSQFKSADDIPNKYYLMWMNVGKIYFRDLLDYDIYKAIKAYKKEVLIVHGDEDELVPLFYSRKAVRIYSSATLKVIKGAGHGFYRDEEDKAVKYILSYLKKQKK